MAYDLTGDTTGLTNEHFTSFPQASFERDRLRLQRELDRDLDHPSFSSSSVSGLENAGRPYNLDLDDTDTFDIDNDARATSTRRMNINTNMLQSSPAVNSRILAAEFADFSMAGNDYTDDDSVEVARGRKDKNMSSQDYSRGGLQYTSVKNANVGTKASSKRLSEAYAAARRDMASPRQSQHNSIRSEASDVLPLNKNIRNAKGKETYMRIEENTVEMPKATHSSPKKTATTARQTSEVNNESKPRKTTEQVPIRGRTNTTNARDARVQVHDDSSVVSIENIVPTKTRKSSRTVTGYPLRETRGPSLKAAMKVAETREAASKRKPSNTTTAPQVPTGFKSTKAFMQELGLEPPTTLKLQNPPTYDETLELTNNQNTNTNEQSFLLPNIAGISELIQQEATRIYNNASASAKKRNPHGQPPSHKPLEAIPIPEDNRAILMAMQLLQDKMTALEEQKAITEKRCEELKDQLRRIREKYESEYQRARAAEEEVAREKRKRAQAFSSEADTEAFRNPSEEIERLKVAHLVEKMKLENSYKAQLDEINQRFEINKIALRNMQDERNTAVNSAASTMASQKHLKEENQRLRNEIDTLKVQRMQYEEQVEAERQAWQAKEVILRRRIDKAREAEGIAREAVYVLQQRLELVDKESKRATTSTATYGEDLRNYLAAQNSETTKPRKNIRSQYTTHSAPATVTVPATTLSQETTAATLKKSVVSKSAPKSVKQAAATSSKFIANSTGNTEELGDDSAYTVDGDYIRRIADEIDEERRRRKAAEKLAATANAEMERIKKIVNNKTTTTTVSKKRSSINISSKRVMESASSGREDNTTVVNIKNLPPRPLSAPPVTQVQTAAHQVTSKPKKKKIIKKVVYYEDVDTTELLSTPSVTTAIKVRTVEPRDLTATVPGPKVTETAKPGSGDYNTTFHTARKNSSTAISRTASHEADAGNTNTHNLPPPPAIPEHIRSVIDVEAEHDPLTCTVCIRKEMQNLQEESRRLAQTNGVDSPSFIANQQQQAVRSTQNTHSPYTEASTLRPSKPADKQLSKVVRGLQDEFVHLKMAYQEKAEEFLSLDPARGKRRRKEITNEINEMVAEMDWKCDLIYALYDVAEEVVGAGASKRKILPGKPGGIGIVSGKGRAKATRKESSKKIGTGATAAGKVQQQVNFMDLNGMDTDEEDAFEWSINVNHSRRMNGNGLAKQLVNVETDEDDESTVNAGGHNQQELSLLDDDSQQIGGATDDDTNKEVARHLARQQEAMKQLGQGQTQVPNRQGRVEEVLDSYDEESTV